MNKNKVNTTCLRYIVPFKVSEIASFQEAIRSVESQKEETKKGEVSPWLREIENGFQGESDAYEYVRNEFRFDGEEVPLSVQKSGARWIHYKSDLVAKDKKTSDDVLDIYYYAGGRKEESKPLKVAVVNLGLYLMKNGLGFIWYELKPKSGLSIDELIEFQNAIKELNRAAAVTIWLDDTNIFSFGDWIADMLAPVNPIFFSSRKSAYNSLVKKADKLLKKINGEDAKVTSEPIANSERQVPDKALLYSYSLVNRFDSQEDLSLTAYYLASGYKHTYKMSPQTSAEVRFPFDNVAWFAAKEGSAIVATSDESNNQFLETGMPKKVQGDYFDLYMKVLYQSYSLLLYAEIIQKEIASDSTKYSELPFDDKVAKLYSEINLFLTKSMAASVSYVHHQSEYFIYLKQQLRIHEDVKSITSGLEALDSLQREERKAEDDKRHAEQMEEEKTRDNKVQAIMILFTLLGISSAYLDCWALLDRVKGKTFEAYSVGRIIVYVISFALITAISVMAIKQAVNAIKSAFKKNKKK